MHYIVTKTYAPTKKDKNGKTEFKIIIPKNSALIVKKIENNTIWISIQGSLGTTKFSIEDFNSIEKKETNFTNEFIENYVENENLIYPKILTELKNYFKNNSFYEKIIQTIKGRWIENTHGSSAIKGSQYVNLDFNNLPWLKDTSKTKDYVWWENRSVRTTYAPSSQEISEWEKDSHSVLPIGIQRYEQCSYPEMDLIALKILKEICGCKNIDQNFVRIVSEYIEIDKNYIHRDYLTNEVIDINLFSKNEHHSKEKGLEMCHIDPSVEYATNVSNITIGLSSSNRAQSGNSLNYMKGISFLLSINEMNIDMNIKDRARFLFENGRIEELKYLYSEMILEKNPV